MMNLKDSYLLLQTGLFFIKGVHLVMNGLTLKIILFFVVLLISADTRYGQKSGFTGEPYKRQSTQFISGVA